MASYPTDQTDVPVDQFEVTSWSLICTQIHANCRVRRVYFADRLYSEDELPKDFRLTLPVRDKKK